MALPGAAPATPPPGGRDHDLVTGHFGIGYLGRRTVQIGGPGLTPMGGATNTAIDAPIIGMRYWLDPMLGLDLGVGFLFSGGSQSTDPGATTDRQGYTAVLIHGGVPLALAGSQHFSFQIVPELNFGYAGSTINGVGAAPEVDLSGIHFDIGARAGTEIQFGFIGIPELSLQAGVGLAYSLDHVKATLKSNPNVSGSVNQVAFGTNVGDNPWNIFTGNIAALYYFD
jgi:hypothetical protein